MAIYRGPGGSGDATNDATSQAILAITAANEASASATSAASSATSASTSAGNASASAGDANSSALLAQDWATKTTGTVNGTEYSAKYYAESISPSSFATAAQGAKADTALQPVNNLSDLNSVSTARTNLGLGTAATTNSTAYATAAQGTAADTAYADRLKWDGGSTGLVAATGRTSLGLGSAATTSSSDYATAAQGTKADSALQSSSIGSTVQAYNANTAFTNTAQTYTVSQRGTVTIDNDGSFDQSVTNNFKCTPTGTFALTFTNHTAGQSGYVLLVNTGGYAITAAATTKVGASTLSTISTTGTYLLSYLDDGTNAYVTASGALA